MMLTRRFLENLPLFLGTSSFMYCLTKSKNSSWETSWETTVLSSVVRLLNAAGSSLSLSSALLLSLLTTGGASPVLCLYGPLGGRGGGDGRGGGSGRGGSGGRGGGGVSLQCLAI